MGCLKYKTAGLSVEHWINDALMAVFFMMVGLELKRELVTTTVSHTGQRRCRALPHWVVWPYLPVGFNAGHDETLSGWAIPAATDIAFALGVLALLGSRVPVSLKFSCRRWLFWMTWGRWLSSRSSIPTATAGRTSDTWWLLQQWICSAV